MNTQHRTSIQLIGHGAETHCSWCVIRNRQTRINTTSFVTTLVYVEVSIPYRHIHQWAFPSRLEDCLCFPERVPPWLQHIRQFSINRKSIAGFCLKTNHFALPRNLVLDSQLRVASPVSKYIQERLCQLEEIDQ